MPPFCAGAAARFHLALDVILGPEGLGSRAIALDDQNVAVGQRVDDARVHEAGRHRLDLQPGGTVGVSPGLPADRLWARSSAE